MSQAHLVSRCQTPAAANWLISTGGHHGRYPLGFQAKVPKNRRFEGGVDGFGALRDELMGKLVELFGPLPEENADGERERIHLLTGFTVFADWIGSNNDWFPPDHPTDLDALRQTAEECLERLRWVARIRSGTCFGRLFQPDSPDCIQPRPIQTALIKAADRPGLYIVEAPMGMGKTEAALAAAYRRWTEGDERGLYFALPTQLTSNRIHDRVHAFLRVATDSESIETLIHGSAWLKDGESRRIVRRPDTDEYNESDEVLRWFSSTRKQLLAPFGTGTVDQALLAVLPAKFAALRYFALAGKVVVIDEVHSYDPYMSELVDRLVGYLIKAGSTVIVLSATLTVTRRRELVEAAGAVEVSQPEAYPLITKAAAGEPEAEHIEIREKLEEKKVRIENRFEADESAAYWQQVAEIVEAGANVVVIRNTVALAQETYLRLRSLLTEQTPADHVGLLHSRFPQNERDERETKWTRLLGKEDADRPSGSLLVSTQIVEQSVDIDADLLVTDLAPIDLILQRIGRLHRHRRSRPPARRRLAMSFTRSTYGAFRRRKSSKRWHPTTMFTPPSASGSPRVSSPPIPPSAFPERSAVSWKPFMRLRPKVPSLPGSANWRKTREKSTSNRRARPKRAMSSKPSRSKTAKERRPVTASVQLHNSFYSVPFPWKRTAERASFFATVRPTKSDTASFHSRSPRPCTSARPVFQPTWSTLK